MFIIIKRTKATLEIKKNIFRIKTYFRKFSKVFFERKLTLDNFIKKIVKFVKRRKNNF